MAEELTRETIQEIVKETIQTYGQQSPDISWIVQTISVVAVIGGLAFSIYRFNKTQKKHNEIQQQHNTAQENAQEQFNTVQEQKRKLQLIEQLAYYDNEIVQLANNFAETNQKFLDCVTYARQYLIILDRISYLKLQKLIDDDFLEYFHPDFNIGKALLKWLDMTHDKNHWDYAALNFRKLKDEITDCEIRLRSSFYYYAHKRTEDPSRDLKIIIKDEKKEDPKLYNATKEDLSIFHFGNTANKSPVIK